MAPQTVLVIGASKGGMGDAIAQESLRRGCRVFATARSLEKMEHLRTIGIETLILDVTSTKSIANAVAEVTKHTEGKLDILYNCSGLGKQNPTWQSTQLSKGDPNDLLKVVLYLYWMLI